MRIFFINIIVLALLALMYYTNFWSWFAFKHSFWYSLIPVAVLLLIGLKVFGNPFDRGNKQ